MIKISCRETVYTYNLYHLAKAFFPEGQILQALDADQPEAVQIMLEDGSGFSVLEEDVNGRGRQEKKKMVTRMVYDWLTFHTKKRLAWGMLTGVRPTKLAMRRLECGDREEQIRRFLQEEYAVTAGKAELAVRIAKQERELLQVLDMQNGFSLYVGIPFCPSICSYCSFSSSPADIWKSRMGEYVDVLCREIRAVGELTTGRKLNTVYIGGGTPTTLEAKQLDRLLTVIDETFAACGAQGTGWGSADSLLEYTVEAGRPDSITREKLEVLRSHPVTRISVNPQTMQQRTLDLVGRRHTVRDVEACFFLARELGFENINMDLIAGLPGETAEDMLDTLRQVEALWPDSLTVHSLAIKRTAKLGQEQKSREAGVLEHGRDEDISAAGAYLSDEDGKGKPNLQKEISRMVEDGGTAAKRMGMIPYYLYRQKNIAGNFENVGYAKAGKAGIYNILIMEEKQTIVACGAGSISKRVYPDGRIERCENVRDVASFIERIDEMIERKRKLLED